MSNEKNITSKMFLADKQRALRVADYLLDNGVDVSEVRIRQQDAVIYFVADYDTVVELLKQFKENHDTTEENN